MSVAVKTGASPGFEAPKALFETDLFPPRIRPILATNTQSRRMASVFWFSTRGEGIVGPVTVVVDWTKTVKGRPGT